MNFSLFWTFCTFWNHLKSRWYYEKSVSSFVKVFHEVSSRICLNSSTYGFSQKQIAICFCEGHVLYYWQFSQRRNVWFLSYISNCIISFLLSDAWPVRLLSSLGNVVESLTKGQLHFGTTNPKTLPEKQQQFVRNIFIVFYFIERSMRFLVQN